jgi:hypothetical protein
MKPEFASLIWDTMPFNWARNCHMVHLRLLCHQTVTDPNEHLARAAVSLLVTAIVSLV